MFIWTDNCITKKTTLVRTVPWMDALIATVQVFHVDCGKRNELNWRDAFADGEDVVCNDGNYGVGGRIMCVRAPLTVADVGIVV